MILYNRTAVLDIGKPGEIGKRIKNRIRFKIEKSSSSETNKAILEVFNLSSETAAMLESSNTIARLFVGYGDFQEVIFIGNIMQPVTQSESGSDLITRINAGDGETSYVNSTIELNMQRGEPISKAFESAFSALDLDRGATKDIPKDQIMRGFSYSGTTSELLDRLSDTYKLHWSVQNNCIQTHAKRGYVREEAVIVSPETGLMPGLSKANDYIVGKVLLQAQISPGKPIKLISSSNVLGKFKSGPEAQPEDFRVDRVVHMGDSEVGEWSTQFWATKITALEAGT